MLSAQLGLLFEEYPITIRSAGVQVKIIVLIFIICFPVLGKPNVRFFKFFLSLLPLDLHLVNFQVSSTSGSAFGFYNACQ